MDFRILLGFALSLCLVFAEQAEEKVSGKYPLTPVGFRDAESSTLPQLPIESADSSLDGEDDSDMYMEPLEDDPQASSSSIEAQADSGHWFPSFLRNYDSYEQPPLGHSRPFFFNGFKQQEGAYSQRNEPVQQDVGFNSPAKYSGLKGFGRGFREESEQQSVTDKSASILGDGNFGVIQGGTFYPEKDGYDSESSGYDDFSSYFHNGHGRPSYFYPSNPKAGKYQQFENFRDFADINAPTDRQYSQYVVVYTNKNGTRTRTNENVEEQANLKPTENEDDKVNTPYNVKIDVKRPKNILESLALLDSVEPTQADDEKSSDNTKVILTKPLLIPSYDHGDIIEIPPEKKMSKSKRKLAQLRSEKKHEAKLLQKAKDMSEPLLALS